jgi:hypothetical protein
MKNLSRGFINEMLNKQNRNGRINESLENLVQDLNDDVSMGLMSPPAQVLQMLERGGRYIHVGIRDRGLETSFNIKTSGNVVFHADVNGVLEITLNNQPFINIGEFGILNMAVEGRELHIHLREKVTIKVG